MINTEVISRLRLLSGVSKRGIHRTDSYLMPKLSGSISPERFRFAYHPNVSHWKPSYGYVGIVEPLFQDQIGTRKVIVHSTQSFFDFAERSLFWKSESNHRAIFRALFPFISNPLSDMAEIVHDSAMTYYDTHVCCVRNEREESVSILSFKFFNNICFCLYLVFSIVCLPGLAAAIGDRWIISPSIQTQPPHSLSRINHFVTFACGIFPSLEICAEVNIGKSVRGNFRDAQDA